MIGLACTRFSARQCIPYNKLCEIAVCYSISTSVAAHALRLMRLHINFTEYLFRISAPKLFWASTIPVTKNCSGPSFSVCSLENCPVAGDLSRCLTNSFAWILASISEHGPPLIPIKNSKTINPPAARASHNNHLN